MILIRKFNIIIIQHNLKLSSHQIIKLHKNLAVKWLIECRCSSSSSNKKHTELTSKVISRPPSKIVFKPIDDKTIMRKLIEEKEKESGSSIDKFKQKSKQNVSHWIDVVTGRALIEWYNKTPPERRPNLIVSWLIKKFYVVAFLTFVWMLWHWLRQQNHPLTGREYFDAISMDLVNTIQEYKFDQFWEEHAHLVIMNTEHQLYKRAQNVFTRLIEANNDLEELNEVHWRLDVIENNNVDQVLAARSIGHLLIFSKMINDCESDDELAFALCHELAHCILEHYRELPKIAGGFHSFLITVFADIWNMYIQTGVERDELRWAERRLCKLSKNIPYKRVYEDEADRIAMQLMTRACFDVRKAKRFWEKRCHLQVDNDKPIDDQFIGVHQGFGIDRVKEVESLIPPFIELRKQCNCPPLN